jgi:flagellar motor protein MotB
MYFTQFMFPNGERRDRDIDMDDATEKVAEELGQAGWRFEIECFPDTQLVHGDCCNEDGQLASFVVPNGPQVPVAIAEMVTAAWALWVAKGKPEASTPGVFEDPE